MAVEQPEIDIAPFIDHSLLTITSTSEEVSKFCTEADKFRFPSVCVYPCYVQKVVDLLYNKNPTVCTVIGFPTGTTTSKAKLYEALEAVENGASELDVMVNLTHIKTGQTNQLHREIAEICEETGKTVKAILEMALLTEEEKLLVTEVLMDAGVAFIVTNTGWYGGATVADVKLLKEITKANVGIKAAGGIKTYEQAANLILAGATRLGTSRGIELLNQQNSHSSEVRS
ncbi:MAG: deoxyribose-phosphate aldolase [Okeania sp. SIO2F4]|uniref:deoxyribose-phosphate aldolase n=1 Tax=Okeania sp. SIO2F4 TaxID=2607790 RepID=UPI00142CBA62|nr:deoxyribose-phosphate aldolase [Okeania sp. SIO2F4]NES04165.1 deoxyribose-phosphate aldolase [Okeania sp. SIO2F4]